MRWTVARSLLLVSLAVQPACSSRQTEKAATSVAESWLALVDQEKYVASWDAAAKPMQKVVDRGRWTVVIKALRLPLGKLVTRHFRSAEYKTSLAGAPPGKYVVVEFESSFQNKADLTEVVIPVLEADGSWRVSSYLVR